MLTSALHTEQYKRMTRLTVALLWDVAVHNCGPPVYFYDLPLVLQVVVEERKKIICLFNNESVEVDDAVLLSGPAINNDDV